MGNGFNVNPYTPLDLVAFAELQDEFRNFTASMLAKAMQFPDQMIYRHIKNKHIIPRFAAFDALHGTKELFHLEILAHVFKEQYSKSMRVK